MTKSGKHFEAFGDHTLLKHAILRAYLQSWAFKLLQWGVAGDTVYYVDGFAGAGKDEKGNAGSPTIACQIAQIVRGRLKSGPRTQSAQLRVIAVESDPPTLARLERHLAPFKRLDTAGVKTLPGAVSDHMDLIAGEIGARPSLYFLDPFGLKGLDAATYPAMLAGPHNEIFALFHDIGAARLRGVVHAGTSVERQMERLRGSPSLFPELDEREASALQVTASEKRGVAERYGPASRAAVSRALGETSWEEELRNMEPEAARQELVLRFMVRLLNSGAKYVQVLPMRGESGAHKYCLVHASKSLKGYTAMKEAVSESLNKDELSSTMRNRIRDDLRMSVLEIIRLLQERFGGEKVRWTGEQNVNGGAVKRFLLEQTHLYPFQNEEIKSELRSRGWLARVKRVEVVSFPKL